MMNAHAEGFVDSIIEIIRQRDGKLADAVKAMYDHITDRYAGPFPTKEQTDAVNRYYGLDYEDASGRMRPDKVDNRRIAAHDIVIGSIRIMDNEQLDRLKDVLTVIAEDPHYHMPERGSRLGR